MDGGFENRLLFWCTLSGSRSWVRALLKGPKWGFGSDGGCMWTVSIIVAGFGANDLAWDTGIELSEKQGCEQNDDTSTGRDTVDGIRGRDLDLGRKGIAPPTKKSDGEEEWDESLVSWWWLMWSWTGFERKDTDDNSENDETELWTVEKTEWRGTESWLEEITSCKWIQNETND